MAIAITCNCGRKLKISEEFAGQEGQCPACGRTLQIPDLNDRSSEPLTVIPVVEAVEDVLPAEDESLKNHGGDLLPADVDFFADVPPEIGPVTSAYSTLRQGKEPWPLWGRLLLIVVLSIAGVFVGLVIDLIGGVTSVFWALVWPLVFSGVGGLIGLGASSFSHTCTYVGRQGVARFACSGRRDKLGTQEVFEFRDATELRTSQTMHYRNGIYQNTAYTFTWTDVGGRKRYTITGSHNKKDGNPPSTDLYHYARAAEFAWTVYLMEQAFRQVELAGGVTFQLGGGHWIRLGPGKLTYSIGGESEEWESSEVAAAIVQQGVVRIKHITAKEGWFSSSGVIKFSFDSLANAQLFFHLLDKLVGVQAQ